MSTFDVIFWGLLLIALIVTTRIAIKREKKFAATRDQFIVNTPLLKKAMFTRSVFALAALNETRSLKQKLEESGVLPKEK